LEYKNFLGGFPLNLANFDVHDTTYHELNGFTWRIDSGTDLANVWDLDIFENHAEEYLEERPERFSRKKNEVYDILEADFGERGYKLVKNREDDSFHFMFYANTAGIEGSESYLDTIWEREIGTILSETAKAKLTARHQLKDKGKYSRRILDKLE